MEQDVCAQPECRRPMFSATASQCRSSSIDCADEPGDTSVEECSPCSKTRRTCLQHRLLFKQGDRTFRSPLRSGLFSAAAAVGAVGMGTVVYEGTVGRWRSTFAISAPWDFRACIVSCAQGLGLGRSKLGESTDSDAMEDGIAINSANVSYRLSWTSCICISHVPAEVRGRPACSSGVSWTQGYITGVPYRFIVVHLSQTLFDGLHDLAPEQPPIPDLGVWQT